MQQYPPKYYIPEDLNLHQHLWENLKYHTTQKLIQFKNNKTREEPVYNWGRFAEYQLEKAHENCMQTFAVGDKFLMTAFKDSFPNTRTFLTLQGEIWHYWGNACKSKKTK